MVHRIVFLTVIVVFSFNIMAWKEILAGTDHAKHIGKSIIMMLDVALKEYGHGVADGKVINAYELDEAKTFTREGRNVFGELKKMMDNEYHLTMEEIDHHFEKAMKTMDEKGDPDRIRDIFTSISKNLATMTSLVIKVIPDKEPSVQNGKRIYIEHCSECHGRKGKGNGPEAKYIEPPPANLTDIADWTIPFENYEIISVGVGGTEMDGWNDELTDDEIWDVTYYIRTFKSQRNVITW